jgi:hypothetical protein
LSEKEPSWAELRPKINELGIKMADSVQQENSDRKAFQAFVTSQLAEIAARQEQIKMEQEKISRTTRLYLSLSFALAILTPILVTLITSIKP